MNIICSKEDLLENINIVSRAVSARATNKISTCILVVANDNGIKLIANDGELGIETSYFKGEIVNVGLIAIEAKIFHEIIRKMPDGNININADENNIVIFKAGKTEFKIIGLNGFEFSFLPIIDKNNPLVVNTNDLKQLIRQTIFSVAGKDTKPIFTGELLEVKNKSIIMVAVDGVRIAYKEIKTETEREEKRVVIPSRTLSEISKILPPEDENCNIYFTDRHVLFELSRFIVVSTLMEGEFIKYDQAFPDDQRIIVNLNREAFLTALERTTLVMDEAKKIPIEMSINEGSMRISSRSEIGGCNDEIEIELEGEPLVISFNPKFLIEALKIIEEEVAILKFKSQQSACTIFGQNNSSYKFLVLPLRR